MNFPLNPVLNQEFTVGERSWIWNSQFWEQQAVAQQDLVTITVNAVPEDGDVLEFSQIDNSWTPTNNTRKLIIDGGNF